MKTQAETSKKPAKLSVLQAKTRTDVQGLAVLEQMFGYFSFDPMPLEAAEPRLAA
ncbi:hypothetical protein [Paracoccus sp. N5]|uniref:hypothetical protein n=1 Tax=Paracoccus sp. N5 TaxID=1101189 RepID=UPI0003653DE7|nr:hypothetical protein [Paracoccus sp. N5]